ncbi:MAG TPA: aldo/keto reductase [Candidatus Dormibacteraeota bacterium]|jgi:aryl-alcohol dehydrogenase-like predicted oxidoreductase
MKQIRLGRSDLQVSRIAFGTWQLGGDWGRTDEKAAINAIRRAFDRGINFFDTAQGYGFGASEGLLATALAGVQRERVIIATKGGLRPTADGVERDGSPGWIRHGVEESLKALRTDYIDLYQVHWPDPRVPFEETAGALAKFVAAGTIRHVGVSNFDATQMEEFSATLPVETLQPPYHLFRREIETSILPYTRSHDIGVLVYGPLAHGLLGGGMSEATRFAPDDWRSKSDVFKGERYRRNLRIVSALERFAQFGLGTTVSQLAVAWTLANPAVQVAIVGTRNPDHVDDAVAAADLVLDDQVLREMHDIVNDEVPVGGPTPESV